MSMEFITLLFEEFGGNVKRLRFIHRDNAQTPVADSFLSPDHVLHFLSDILRHCPLIEVLELDVDILHPAWFPEDVVFLEVKSLQLDTSRLIVDMEETEEATASLAARMVSSIPNLETFVTRELWSSLQANLLYKMASKKKEDSNRWWPNLKGIKILHGIRFESRLPFVKNLIDLGGPDWGQMNRYLTHLHLGTVHAQQLRTAFRILNSFRISLVDVEMSVEIKDRLIPNNLQFMPHLTRLSFVACAISKL